MEKERPSHKWASDKAKLFSEILVDPVNNFMDNLKREREALKKHSIQRKKLKTFEQIKKKSNWWSKSKRFFEKL